MSRGELLLRDHHWTTACKALLYRHTRLAATCFTAPTAAEDGCRELPCRSCCAIRRARPAQPHSEGSDWAFACSEPGDQTQASVTPRHGSHHLSTAWYSEAGIENGSRQIQPRNRVSIGVECRGMAEVMAVSRGCSVRVELLSRGTALGHHAAGAQRQMGNVKDNWAS
ncbi:hypothetical protein VTK56DRAFT_5372 [Thermocarpiscus australiensis]